MKQEIIGQGAVVVLVAAIVAAVVGGAIGYLLAPAAEVPPDIAELQATISELQSTVSTQEGRISDLEAELAAIPEKPGEGLHFDVVTNGSPGDPYWAVVKKGTDDASALLGIDTIFHFAPGDVPGQVADLDTAVGAGVDGIILCDIDPSAFHSHVQAALDAGIPVVEIICADPSWTADEVPYVGFSLYDSGYEMGKWLAQHMEDGDHVLISAEVWASYATDRRDGYLDAWEDAGLDISWDGLVCTDDMATAEERITSYLAGHPEIDIAVGVGGITTERTVVSIKSLGKEPGEIVWGGFDLLPETVEGIKDGYGAAIMGQQYLNGFYSIVSLFMKVKYEFSMPNISFGWAAIDSTNIAEVEEYIEEHIK